MPRVCDGGSRGQARLAGLNGTAPFDLPPASPPAPPGCHQPCPPFSPRNNRPFRPKRSGSEGPPRAAASGPSSESPERTEFISPGQASPRAQRRVEWPGKHLRPAWAPPPGGRGSPRGWVCARIRPRPGVGFSPGWQFSRADLGKRTHTGAHGYPRGAGNGSGSYGWWHPCRVLVLIAAKPWTASWAGESGPFRTKPGCPKAPARAADPRPVREALKGRNPSARGKRARGRSPQKTPAPCVGTAARGGGGNLRAAPRSLGNLRACLTAPWNGPL